MSNTGAGPGDGTRLADEEPLTPDEALALLVATWRYLKISRRACE